MCWEASEVLHLPKKRGGAQQVLAILKEGHKFWDSFNMGA